MSNDTAINRKRAAAFIKHAFPAISEDQVGALVEQTVRANDLMVSDRVEYEDPRSVESDTGFGYTVRRLVRENPELVASPVDRLELAKQIRRDWEKQVEAKMGDAAWLETMKRVEALSSLDALREAKKVGLELKPASAEPVQETSTVAPKLFRNLSLDELDDLTEQRLGTKRHTWTVKQRLGYHAALKAQDPPQKSVSSFDKAIKQGNVFENRELSAQERIAAFRRQQGSK